MIDISVFLLGAILTAIPLIIWYLKKIGQTYVSECQKSKKELDSILDDLNKLHNSAVSKYNSLDSRMMKIETEIQATRYGKVMK